MLARVDVDVDVHVAMDVDVAVAVAGDGDGQVQRSAWLGALEVPGLGPQAFLECWLSKAGGACAYA